MPELDPLTRCALLGTSHAPVPVSSADPIADRALRALACETSERRVLLAAGVRAIGRRAGFVHRQLQPEHLLPEDDPRRECSARAAAIVAELLDDPEEDLSEALGLLGRSGQRLPHIMLPLLLRSVPADLRGVAKPSLGPRGRWLARMNPEWAWANEDPLTQADLLRAWDEGRMTDRLQALEQTRSRDPALARQWLHAVWSVEKADARAAFLELLEAGLSEADEPFLEQARRDRAAVVRATARRLLSLLPSSAFVQRTARVADDMIRAKKTPFALSVRIPAGADAETERDLDKPAQGVSRTSHWLHQTVGLLPLDRWQHRFGVAPTEIVDAAARSDWAFELNAAFSVAAARGSADPAWTRALLGFWRRVSGVADELRAAYLNDVLAGMAAPDVAALAIEVLQGKAGLPSLEQCLIRLGAEPWPAELGFALVAQVRNPGEGIDATTLLESLGYAAASLARECFADALQPFDLSSASTWWRQGIQRFQQAIERRAILYQELCP